MAQNFWTAIFAWCTCFLATVIISLFTRPRPDEELRGLVYSETEKPKELGLRWYERPLPLAVVVVVLAMALNVIFW
jgi:SSS family solute:Na+ symporter